MPFNDLELRRIENSLAIFLAKKRPPEHIRAQLDFGYKLSGLSIELVEIRPQWDDPSIIHKRPFAKATFVKSQNVWKVFWQRADLKWHGYKPDQVVSSFEQFLAVVGTDEYGCFFG